MKFVDEVIISVQSGDGGKGCVSFRREKFIPRGGPDGGDGGKGGNVVLKTTLRKQNLYHFKYKSDFKASKGASGQARQKTGKNGKDLILEIPRGTLIHDAATGQLLKDMVGPDEIFIVARGGRGGMGNKHFATSTHRTPRFAQPGEPGEKKTLRIELKLLADVGIIGLPNAGKSTLLRAISSAEPAVGDYPFTTLNPHLGVVHKEQAEPFVVADIPGLIKGAHQGAGLGIKFLKHIERTRVLVHLLDASAIDPAQPLAAYQLINDELSSYSKNLAEKPQIVVLNKVDLPEAEGRALSFRQAFKKNRILSISALKGVGIDELLLRLQQKLSSLQPLP